MAILLATTAASAAASSSIIVRAGISPAFVGAAMVVDNNGRRPPHSVTAIAVVSLSAAPSPRRPAALLPRCPAAVQCASGGRIRSGVEGGWYRACKSSPVSS